MFFHDPLEGIETQYDHRSTILLLQGCIFKIAQP